MTSDLAQQFSQSSRALVVAPAGCGKTELIVDAVSCSRECRMLILTHTHAGVRALLDRLRRKGVPRNRYSVDTIAGWALRYATAFPSLSGIQSEMPMGQDWQTVYGAASRALSARTVRRVVRLSYGGVFVDEYQDCKQSQHNLILSIAELLPCRVVGDPLQGIFNFGAEPEVDWVHKVEVAFEKIGELTFPWRWKRPGQNGVLGEWLLDARRQLLAGSRLNLADAPIQWIESTPENTRKACLSHNAKEMESIVAICRFPKDAYTLAKCLKGRLRCMEEVECKDLLRFAKTIGETTGSGRSLAIIDFASTCMTRVSSELGSIRKCLLNGKVPTAAQHRKHPAIVNALLEASRTPELYPAAAAMKAIEALSGAVMFRRELYREMQKTIASNLPNEKLENTAWRIRDAARRYGRRIEPRCVSRTLLVKGLEFDHAIVPKADELDTRNLYVALTRASKSLTVLSKTPDLEARVK